MTRASAVADMCGHCRQARPGRCRAGVARVWRSRRATVVRCTTESRDEPGPRRSDARRHARVGASRRRSPCSMPTAPSSPRSATSSGRSFRAPPSRCCRRCRSSRAAPPTQLGLDDEELAVACASHNGEPAHTAVVARMLAKAGLDASALECGTHWPYREPIQRRMAAAGDRAERPAQQLLGQARRLSLRRLPDGERRRPARLRAGLRRRRASGACAPSPRRCRPPPASIWPAPRAAPTAARSRPTRSRCASWRTLSHASAAASA